MKKLLHPLLVLCALIFQFNAAYAQETDGEGTEVAEPIYTNTDKNIKITEIEGGYLVEPIDAEKAAQLSGLNQDCQEFQTSTGKIVLKGTFSAVQLNNAKFTNVDLSELKYAQENVISYWPYQAELVEKDPYDLFANGIGNMFGSDVVTLKLPDTGGELVSPSIFTGLTKIEYIEFGEEVTKIADSNSPVFQNNTTLKKVVFGSSLQEIGNNAFNGASNLATVNFPSSLKRLGNESFKGTAITSFTVNSNLERIEYEAFQGSKLSSFTIPAENSLNFVGNDIFTGCENLEELDLSNLTGITEFDAYIGADNSYTGVVYNCTNLKRIIYPPYIKEIDASHFNGCTSLEYISIGEGIETIKAGSFAGSDWGTNLATIEFRTAQDSELGLVTSQLKTIEGSAFSGALALTDIDFSQCHKLTTISGDAFASVPNLKNVKLCSHPKTIKTNAFNQCKGIRVVEVVYCANTDVTQCVCENQAFMYDITNNQTEAGTVNEVDRLARLIFTTDGDDLIPEDSPYKSVFDYFVGEYKTGQLITQAVLNDAYKDGGSEGNTATGPLTYGNGWWEFINAGSPIVVTPDDNGTFLRTYSRTAGTGAVILPDDVIAYRMVDYINTEFFNELNLTISGYFDLRKLEFTMTNGKVVSYVPENTGVVLWSPKKNEDAGILVLNPCDEDIEELLQEYPNTQGHYNRDGSTEASEDRVNLLLGSFGETPQVGPVDSYDFDKKVWKKDKAYRNFGLSVSAQQWQRIKPTNIRANRAWAQIPLALFTNNNETLEQSPNLDMEKNNMIMEEEDNGDSNNICIGMVFDGDLNGIVYVKVNADSADDAWYTLQGVRVAQPTKGIYIHQNKKVVIK